MIRETTSEDVATFTVAGCFCLFGDEVLLVQRQRDKPLAFHWAIPAGKLEAHEDIHDGMIRELNEEVGILISTDELVSINDQIVLDSPEPFRFISFALRLARKPTLHIKSDEIKSSEWVDRRCIAKRRVVPFFWDGIVDLQTWLTNSAIQPRLFPTPAAISSRGWSGTH